ncbi:MAG: polyhydroxyalkanoate depolymerase [Pseudomonadota bacterium]
MLYHLYEINHAAITPFRRLAGMSQRALNHPLNPLSYTGAGKATAAALDVFERTTRRYGKPKFDLPNTLINGMRVPVTEQIVWKRPFCRLKYFQRDPELLAQLHPKQTHPDPTVLIVAPLSGHYATLLRGTVEAMLPGHEVYITDWVDARMVPIYEGRFDLNDYIDYVTEMITALGPQVHVMAVCQPGPAVLSAAAVLAEQNHPCQPASMVIMGSPIDPRESPTEPNRLAMSKPIEWFRSQMISTVPFPNPGCMREVYPGFLQLAGFMAMNLDRHIDAHKEYFEHLVEDDGDGAQKHREFYNEYLAVMDLTKEFYLQTIEDIFQEYKLAKGTLYHRGKLIKPQLITRTALMTVEGENDDISGIGQTQAAHTLCPNIPADMQVDYIQPKVGHYGVFNGSRFRAEIQPRIADFIRTHDKPLEKRGGIAAPRRTRAA